MNETVTIVNSSTNRKIEVLEQWYFDYREELYQWLTYATGSRDVEFLMIETFRHAAKNFHHFNDEVSPRLWLLSIARKLVKQQEPNHTLQLPDHVAEIYTNVQRLQPIYREIFILQGIMELSPVEVAVVLKISPSKAERYFQRLLSLMRKEFPHHDPLHIFEQFPKPILYADQNEYIYEVLQQDWQLLMDRAKQRQRIRWISFAAVCFVILTMTVFISVTDTGKSFVWNVWAKLNQNIVKLEDGVIAQFGEYVITEADFENVERTSHLQELLATLMVYEEALAKGYQPNLQQVEEELANLRETYQSDEISQANMFELMQRANMSAEEYWEHKQKWLSINNVVKQYYIDLFGAPYFPEKPLPQMHTYHYSQYIEKIKAFKKKMLVKHYDKVIVNQSYDYEFHWREWLDQWRLPNDVIVMHLDEPIVTHHSLQFEPEHMTELELQKYIGRELLFKEAQVRSITFKGKVQQELERLREQYAMDPQVKETVQKEMEQRNLTEEQYWSEKEQILYKNMSIEQYIYYLYPNTDRLEDEPLQRIMDLVSLEKFHMMKEQLVLNERYLRQYNWDIESVFQVPEEVKNSVVAIQYKDFRIWPLQHLVDRSRFDTEMYEIYLFFLMLADIARDLGYTYNIEQSQQYDDQIQQIIDRYYERLSHDEFRYQISDYLRISGMTLDELLEQERKINESVSIIYDFLSSSDEKFSELRSKIMELDSKPLDWLKEEYPQYWQYVEFNPNYPFGEVGN